MAKIIAWLGANFPSIIICAVLIAVVALLIYSLIRDKKKGRSSCCGGCSGCAMSGTCHASAKTEKNDNKVN